MRVLHIIYRISVTNRGLMDHSRFDKFINNKKIVVDEMFGMGIHRYIHDNGIYLHDREYWRRNAGNL